MDRRFDALNRRFDTLMVTLIAAMLSGGIGLIASNFFLAPLVTHGEAGYSLAEQPNGDGRRREQPVESGVRRASTATNGVANGTAAPAETLDVLNPATGALIETIAVDSPAAVAETVARVRANQAEWEAIGIEGRYHWLGKLRDWMLDNAERIGDTMQAETGKVRADATTETLYLPT